MAGTSPAMTSDMTIKDDRRPRPRQSLGRRRRLRRGRGGLGRLGRLVEALDLRIGAQLADEVHLRLALDVALELALHLVELRRLALALVLDLEDVPAELGLDRLGDLALGKREGDLREFRHHLVLGKVAEIRSEERRVGKECSSRWRADR